MAYSLTEIRTRTRRDPAAFLAECDEAYQARIRHAAGVIVQRMEKSPIVLLSGPSGSGKTTSALKLEEELETDSSLTQTDLNSKSQEIYELWDSALNQLWDVLEKSKTSQEMEKLLSEQRQWIKQKEAAAEDAGAAYEGRTLQSMAVSQKAAELTKERVYELLEYLD